MVGARACHSRALGKQSSTLLSRLHDMRLTRAAGTWAATIPHKVDADWSRPAARLAVCLCAGHREGCVRQRRPSRQRMRTGPPSAGPRAHIKTTNSSIVAWAGSLQRHDSGAYTLDTFASRLYIRWFRGAGRESVRQGHRVLLCPKSHSTC